MKELKNGKKAHKGLMGALKNHFKGEESKEVKEEENEEKHYKSKNMDKGSRKKMAIMLMKKKMA